MNDDLSASPTDASQRTQEPAPTRSLGAAHVFAACGTVLGPLGAWLYESGYVRLLDAGHLLELWLVVALAITGIVIGIYVVARGAWAFGLASVAVNSAVAALYGFLGVFFGLGGAR